MEEGDGRPSGQQTGRVSAGATQTAAPPPLPPQPRLVMTSPSGSRRWWWLIALLAIATVAAVVIWHSLLAGDDETVSSSPSPSPVGFAWAGAWARTDGSGGGLVVESGDGVYQVTAYDEALRSTATAEGTIGEDGSALAFTLPTVIVFGAAGELARGTLSAGEAEDAAALSVVRDDGTTLHVPLRRVTALIASSPGDGPSPSPSWSRSPSLGPGAAIQRQQMIAAIERIQAGIEEWAAANGGRYPMPADVREGYAVGAYVDPWPENPYAPQKPLAPGTAAGAYTYEQLAGGGAYALTGHLDNGAFVVP